MQKVKSVIGVVLSVLLLLFLGANIFAGAVLAKDGEEKFFCNATLDEEFADDSVIVVMKAQDSQKNLKRLPGYFDSSVEQVEDLTYFDNTAEKLSFFNESEFHQIFLLKLKKPGKSNVLTAIAKLEKKDFIKYVGPNYIFTSEESVDPITESSAEIASVAAYSNNDTYYSSQYALQKIQAEEAWNISAGNSSVMVGVMDSGIDITHPDLDGRVHPTLYANFTGETTAHSDLTGHGTRVAGIIGAEPNNGVGVAGVCRDVTLVSIKVLKQDPSNQGISTGSTSWAINGIQFAIQNNIPILNYSAGGASYNSAYRFAISNYTGLLVCAAGNEGSNNDTTPFYPSSYDCDNILAVASSDSNDIMASTSCYGAASVDVFAPGAGILSTTPNGQIERKSGTSMATPVVTGIAALIKSIRPDLSATQIKQCILQGTDFVTSLSNYCVAKGRVNAHQSLQIASDYTEGEYVVATLNGNFDGATGDDIAMVSYRYNTGETAIKVMCSDGTAFQQPAFWWSSGTRSLDAAVISKRIVCGDFNGDGKDDIAALLDLGQQNMQVIVWTSTGVAFSHYQVWADHSTAYQYNVDLVANRVVAGDFNGDGKDDIATMHDFLDQNMKIFVWKSTGAGFVMQTWFESLESKSYNASLINGRMVAGDFNGDGKDDIGAMHDFLDQNMKIFVWSSNGTNFAMQTWHQAMASKEYNANLITGRMVAGDFNGDGKDDIGAMHDFLNQNMKIFVWNSNGSSFSSVTAWSDYSFAKSYNADLVTNRFIAGDYNSDGCADVAGLHDFSNHLRLFVWDSTSSSFENFRTPLSTVLAY